MLDHGRHRDVGGAGGEHHQEHAVPHGDAEGLTKPEGKTGMNERPHHSIHDQPFGNFFQILEMSGGGDAHIQKKERQHPLEDVPRERLHHRLAPLSGEIAHHHAAEEKDLGSLGKGLLQDVPGRGIGNGCLGPPFRRLRPDQIGHENGKKDGG